jgi:hypothetical protein
MKPFFTYFTTLMAVLLSINGYSQKVKNKSAYFLTGSSVNNLTATTATGDRSLGMGVGITGECGYRIKKHTLSFQTMGRLSRVGVLFTGAEASILHSFAYGYRLTDRELLTFDLHAGAGIERFSSTHKLQNQVSHWTVPVYGTLNFAFSKSARHKTDLWLGMRAGYYLSYQRSLPFLQLHTALVIPH